MQGISVAIIGSFLLAFKAVLLEGSEVAILSLATIKQLGKRNVLLGVVLGGLGSLVILFVINRIFAILNPLIVDALAGLILLAFAGKFWDDFYKFYSGKESFREDMSKEAAEIVEKDLEHTHTTDATTTKQIPFSPVNALPVLTITLTEGFEASLVIAAAGTFNVTWTIIGGIVSLALIIGVAAVSYDYFMRVPRWLLDIIAGVVLLSFGLLFLASAAGIIA